MLKAENLQLTGSFKARGATNMIGRLSAEALRAGVVAASAGNHAQAVACAARDAGARAVLVMPEEAPVSKVAAVRQYGGEVRLHGGNYDDAHAEAARLVEAGGPDGRARVRRGRGGGRARARSGSRSRARRRR